VTLDAKDENTRSSPPNQMLPPVTSSAGRKKSPAKAGGSTPGAAAEAQAEALSPRQSSRQFNKKISAAATSPTPLDSLQAMRQPAHRTPHDSAKKKKRAARA